jgi:Trypsin-like peptidase domain
MTDPEYGLRRVAWFAPRDDRREPFTTPGVPAAMQRHAARTCYLIGATAIASRRTGRVRLHHEGYGSANSLCADEPFREQPVVVERQGAIPGDFGYTGYLVGPDRVLTCWHGWEYFSGRAQLAIFGYALHPGGAAATELPASQVLAVAAYPADRPPPAAAPGSCSGDWVVLRLEHPVTHLGELASPRLATPRPGRSVYALGHPRGLPLKLAADGVVLGATDGALRTNLDTFVGNSGSPIFDADSHALVGLVIEGQKGQDDFAPASARRCYATNRIDVPAEGQLSVPAGCFASAVSR